MPKTDSKVSIFSISVKEVLITFELLHLKEASSQEQTLSCCSFLTMQLSMFHPLCFILFYSFQFTQHLNYTLILAVVCDQSNACENQKQRNLQDCSWWMTKIKCCQLWILLSLTCTLMLHCFIYLNTVFHALVFVQCLLLQIICFAAVSAHHSFMCVSFCFALLHLHLGSFRASCPGGLYLRPFMFSAVPVPPLPGVNIEEHIQIRQEEKRQRINRRHRLEEGRGRDRNQIQD